MHNAADSWPAWSSQSRAGACMREKIERTASIVLVAAVFGFLIAITFGVIAGG